MKPNELTAEELRLADLGCQAETGDTFSEYSKRMLPEAIERRLPGFISSGHLVDKGVIQIVPESKLSRQGMPFDD